MVEPNWALSEDFKTVTLTFPTNPPVSLQLDVKSVDDILRNLGEFRGAMKPEVPENLVMGEKVQAIINPKWFTAPEPLNGDTQLHIRDPRYGWVHYLIPRFEAEKLSDLIQKQVTTPPLGPEQDKPN